MKIIIINLTNNQNAENVASLAITRLTALDEIPVVCKDYRMSQKE